MRELRVAESAGFCFGVSRSLEIAEKLLEEKVSCASFGQLIHNKDAVCRLEKNGLRVIENPDELIAGETVLIRAHGVSREAYERLRDAGGEIVDATCPKVKAIHTIVSRASEDGRFVIIIGTPGHPEVEGIRGWCKDCKVFGNSQELEIWLDKNTEYWGKPITVVVQTTQTRSNFTECCNAIKKRCTNTKISDTICLATFTRQEEAAKLASECDAMVVIGGKNSANSRHLAEICSEHCGNVQFIENASELDVDRLNAAGIVGLTAGASTPAWIIKEVRNKMSDEIKIEETPVEKEMSFDEMLEETLKTIYNGDKVTGIVVAITGTEISVDLGAKYSGFIPTSEFTDDGVKVEDVVKVGDTIEAVVVRVNDVDGYVEALNDVDGQIAELMGKLGPEDLLIITADHGCDPGFPGTDHTREYVPCLCYGKQLKEGVDLGIRHSFSDVAATIAEDFAIDFRGDGKSFWLEMIENVDD